MTRRPVFAVLSVTVLVLTATQLALYTDASVTSSHFDPMRPGTVPRLHINAIHGLWFLSVVFAALLTVAYAGGARLRSAAVAAIGACCLGASVWTTPLRLGAIAAPVVVRAAELEWALALAAAAVIAFVTALVFYRQDSTTS